MFYIFKDNECVASCDFKPDSVDLNTRNEICVEHLENVDINSIMLDKEGNIIIKPEVIPTDTELIQAIRIKRDKLLSASDWTQFPDCQLSNYRKQEWIKYRQALRDFPATCDINNPIFPSIPI